MIQHNVQTHYCLQSAGIGGSLNVISRTDPLLYVVTRRVRVIETSAFVFSSGIHESTLVSSSVLRMPPRVIPTTNSCAIASVAGLNNPTPMMLRIRNTRTNIQMVQPLRRRFGGFCGCCWAGVAGGLAGGCDAIRCSIVCQINYSDTGSRSTRCAPAATLAPT